MPIVVASVYVAMCIRRDDACDVYAVHPYAFVRDSTCMIAYTCGITYRRPCSHSTYCTILHMPLARIRRDDPIAIVPRIRRDIGYVYILPPHHRVDYR